MCPLSTWLVFCAYAMHLYLWKWFGWPLNGDVYEHKVLVLPTNNLSFNAIF